MPSGEDILEMARRGDGKMTEENLIEVRDVKKMIRRLSGVEQTPPCDETTSRRRSWF